MDRIASKGYRHWWDILIAVRKSNGHLDLLKSDEMWQILERERARADRGGTIVSLIVFDVLGSKKVQLTTVARLAINLKKQIRKSDEVGWINDRLGVILVHASTEQAQVFVERVFDNTTLDPSVCTYSIYTYPTDQNSKNSFSASNSRVHFSAELSEMKSGDAHHKHTNGQWIVKPTPVWKRMVDIIVSVFLLIFFMPVLVVAGLFVKVVSPGPIFFKQERLGYRGKPFCCWKLRTMEHGADGSIHQEHVAKLIQQGQVMTKLDTNERSGIIMFGSLLRNSGIDELPQLINVLRGDMSLVGPRPCLSYEANHYSRWQLVRFNVLPGLTGLWQVSGKNRLTFLEMIRLDLNYVNQRSLLLDLRIIFATLPAIISELTAIRKRRVLHKHKLPI